MRYYLLPFKFYRLGDKEILVSELGNYLIVPRGVAELIITHKLSDEDSLYKDLAAGGFISETPLPPLLDNYAVRLRTKKSFLNNFTALHIVVLTIRCNLNCAYCQASSQPETASRKYDISKSDLLKAIDLIFQSPSPDITIEFQGGEPTLVPNLLYAAVEYAEKKSICIPKRVSFVLCTNAIALSGELLNFCKEHNIFISTSFDGPAFLHNINRGKKSGYEKFIIGLQHAREILGRDRISALMTTSVESLKYSKEIVDEYVTNGFNHIFLRPLNPYGPLRNNIDWRKYTYDFIAFYKKTLEYILKLNLRGIYIVEDFTTILLRKILTPYSDGFVDLQSPAGLINGVAVYNYDGKVYASDESRMMAEWNDFTFCMV